MRGLVTSGEARWAIVSSDGRDLLVREEDELDGGWIVAAIETHGVTLTKGERRELIAFDATVPVRTLAMDTDGAAAPAGSAPPQRVRTAATTVTELRDLIQRAESERRARGLAPHGPATR